MKIEILILDYNRPEELKLLLESLRENAKFDKDVVVLNNGGNRYADEYKEQGLCDRVIHFDRGVGCGFGTIHLFAQCRTEYAFYIQVDHYLAYELNDRDIDGFVEKIDKEGYFYVDVAGDQGHGSASERASFFNVFDYMSMERVGGGPGCWNHLKWTEESLQDHMRDRGLKYYSFYQSAWLGDRMVKLPPFIDNGKWSVRENADGSQWRHKPSTKELWLIKGPVMSRFTYPKFTDLEWDKVIETQEWNGVIPELELPYSFKVAGWD